MAGAAGVGEAAGSMVAGVGDAGGCGDGDDNCVESREEAKRGPRRGVNCVLGGTVVQFFIHVLV